MPKVSAPDPGPPPVATIKETMETLRVSRSTVVRLVRDGDLEATYVGTRPRILTASILAYLERNHRG